MPANRSAVSLAILGFIAGALSVITFMSAGWAIVQGAGFVPASAPALWSWTPPIPPFNVPRVLNLMFWGGVWGLVLALLLSRLSGAASWIAWFLAGAIAVAAGAVFVVPAIKGLPIVVTPQRLMISAFLNGIYGLGAAAWLSVLPGRRA